MPGTRTIRPIVEGGRQVEIIDQTRLPHEFVLRRLATPEDAAEAIAVMRVRGAPLIGATAAYGMALAADRDASDAGLAAGGRGARRHPPHGRQPALGVERMLGALLPLPGKRALTRRLGRGGGPLRGGRGQNRAIGRHGLDLIRAARKTGPGEHPHPLQRRLARHRGLGHRPGPDLRRRTRPACPSTSGWTRPGRATRAPA
jgi:methylthioribose-1-phosphate isomerase